MKQIVFNNQKIIIKDEDFLGGGGEGDVFKYKDIAIKLYHNPTNDKVEKIKAIPKNMSQFICQPIDLVYSLSSNVIGYAMPILDQSYIKLSKLSIKSYRSLSDLTLYDISMAFDNGLRTLKNIHSKSILVGDLNKYGIFYKNKGLYFIDSDSFSFNGYKCVVYTDETVDPLVDLNTLNYTQYSDYYSFLVLFLISTLMVHPFGGCHPTFVNKKLRFENSVTVFDPSVIYPNTVALQPDFLTDDLLNVYHEWFAKKVRENLKDDLFSEYANNLITCPTCKATYPKQRKHCPSCTTQAPVSTVQVTNAKTLIQCSATEIIDYRILNGVIQCLVKNTNNILYIQDDRSQKPVGLAKPNHTQNFWLNGIIECDNNGNLSDYGTTTDTYDNEPVYGANSKYLYRLSGYSVLRGEYKNNEYQENVIRVALPKQTWFKVDKTRDLVYGFIRSGDIYSHWLIKDGLNYDVDLDNFKKGEVLLDTVVKFTSKSALIIHKTKYRGKEQYKISEITLQGNLIRPTLTVDWVDFLPDTIGYVTGSLFKATDRGVVRFNLETGVENTFAHTIDLVNQGNALELYQNGILVIKDRSVIYIQ